MSKEFLDRPVFICGHRKTGTTLLINLFDGNDEAVVYPDDSGMFYMYYPRFTSDEYTREEKLSRLGDVMVNEHLRDIQTRPECTSEEKDKLNQGLEDFHHAVKTYTGDTDFSSMLKHFISGFHNAFYAQIKEPKAWIEKTTSTEIYAAELADFFPQAKFIHLIRDPRDNWASLQSGWQDRYKDFNDDLNRLKQSMFERGYLGMKMAEYNLEVLGSDRYKVIRFEDLTADPNKTMRELAKFIGIEYSDALLKPTIMGYPWKGNNFEGKKFDKVSAVNVNKWKNRIAAEDAMLIEFYFGDLMRKYNYELCFSPEEQLRAATKHYKWFNFSTPYSAK